MLSRRHRAAETTAATLADDVERVRAALTPPSKPSSMVLAERTYTRLRKERAALLERQRDLAQQAFRKPGDVSVDDLNAVEADIQVLSEEVATARRTLDAERQKFGATFLQHVGVGTIVGETMITDLLRLIDDAITPYHDLAVYAAGNGLPTPRMVAAAAELSALARQMRRAMPRR